MFVEESDIVGAMFERVRDAIFDKFLSEVHVFGDGVECHFGFNHPEFGEVARRVRPFGAESRAESVDCAESGCSEFSFKLAADG